MNSFKPDNYIKYPDKHVNMKLSSCAGIDLSLIISCFASSSLDLDILLGQQSAKLLSNLSYSGAFNYIFKDLSLGGV